MKPNVVVYDELVPEERHDKPVNRAERRRQFRYLQRLKKHKEKVRGNV